MEVFKGYQKEWGGVAMANIASEGHTDSAVVPALNEIDAHLAINVTSLSHRKRSSNEIIRCMMSSCNRNLKRKYNKRCRLCSVHIASTELLLDGRLQRFCQKCSKPHPLEEFEGLKRSCRLGLERHNIRQKALRSLKSRSSSARSSELSLSVGTGPSFSDPGQAAVDGPIQSVCTETDLGEESIIPVEPTSPSTEALLMHCPAPPPLPSEKQLADFTLDDFLLSSEYSDDSLVEWLISGQNYPGMAHQISDFP